MIKIAKNFYSLSETIACLQHTKFFEKASALIKPLRFTLKTMNPKDLERDRFHLDLIEWIGQRIEVGVIKTGTIKPRRPRRMFVLLGVMV